MKLPPILLGLLAVISLAGCASGPDFQTYSASVAPIPANEGRIWFYRPGKFFGWAVQPSVYLNKAPVGSAQPGSFFYADRPAGTYEVKCTTEWSDTAQVSLLANQTKYVQLSVSMGLFVGHMVPTEVDATTALKELPDCHLLSDWTPEKSPPPSAGP